MFEDLKVEKGVQRTRFFFPVEKGMIGLYGCL